jgi:hypothetical protein
MRIDFIKAIFMGNVYSKETKTLIGVTIRKSVLALNERLAVLKGQFTTMAKKA